MTDADDDKFIPDLDEPSSQLFLSCDLTGSTDFKQKQAQDPAKTPWQDFFLQFYRDFPQQIASTQREMETEHLNFELWKPIGDELIYSCEVRKEGDVFQAVRTWIAAMHAYRLSSLADETTMGTKGGAFIATFPGPDSKSSIPRDPGTEVSDINPRRLNRSAYWPEKRHGDYLYDYFGPSIDTGFRVISMCKPRYFTVSVEVALAMIGRSKVLCKAEDDFHVDDLVLLDFVELKGVWGGREYPVIAIDLEYHDVVNQAYEQIHGRGKRDELLNLCRACYNSEGWPFLLYLPESADDHFHKVPVDKLATLLTTRPEGMERRAEEAGDEPDDPAELGDNAPLGDAPYRVGVSRTILPRGLTPSEVLESLTREIQLDLDERIVQLNITGVESANNSNEAIYNFEYRTQKAKAL